mmetsp:Transcript_86696/g.245841  ORF Transcript_86696/g.245841 Transcript_86696/m.245841 type:complete len:220 (-) Transcript_86696:378-1037(-)
MLPEWISALSTLALAMVAKTPTPSRRGCERIACTHSATRLRCQRSSSSPKTTQTGRSWPPPGSGRHRSCRAASAMLSAARKCWNCVWGRGCLTCIVAKDGTAARQSKISSTSVAYSGVVANQLIAMTSSVPESDSCCIIDWTVCSSRLRRSSLAMWTAISATTAVRGADAGPPVLPAALAEMASRITAIASQRRCRSYPTRTSVPCSTSSGRGTPEPSS